MTQTINTSPAQPAGSPASEIVRVALGTRSYDIVIGADLLAQAGHYIAPLLPRPKTVIITDTNVGETHLKTLQTALDGAGIEHASLLVPAGEASKNFAQLEKICDWLLEQKIEREDCIIALLAQVDSSIGGKTAVNASLGKNLIGAFHRPDFVLADMDVLKTLPPRELRAGYAEIVKYGALGDRAFFDWLETNGQKVMALDTKSVAHAVAQSCRAKAAIVARDEREAGERALLNLGHTFGHAFEKLTGYGEALLHGEAVAYGMVLAFAFSAHRGECDPQDATRLQAHLAACGLPASMAQVGNGAFDAQALIEAMGQDKKVKAGKMRFILARGLGDTYIAEDVTPEALLPFLIAQGARKPR